MSGTGSLGGMQIFTNATNRSACATGRVGPVVTVCQPVNGTYSTPVVAVQANAYDVTPVTALQEYIDGTKVYQTSATRMNQRFVLAPGQHQLNTKAWDGNGTSFRSNRHITVYRGTPGAVCPAAPQSANICLPQGDTASSPLHILANGSTATVPVAAQLYIDGVRVVKNSQDGDSYVDTMQNLSSGSHYLTFKLWDDQGHVYVAHKTVTVQ